MLYNLSYIVYAILWLAQLIAVILVIYLLAKVMWFLILVVIVSSILKSLTE